MFPAAAAAAAAAATKLNNLGVACLDIGDFGRAMDLFRVALKYTMSDLQLDDCERARMEIKQHNAEMKVDCSVSKDIDAGATATATAGGKPNAGGLISLSEVASKIGLFTPVHFAAREVPPSSQFVHASGINLIASQTAYSPDIVVNATIVSSIIMFNMGVVSHLKGLEQFGNSIARLCKARSLYHKSHLLMKDAGVPMGATGNPVIDMLSMAIFNNMAQSSFELRSYGESRSYFHELIRFASTVLPSQYDDAFLYSYLDQQKSIFLLNAIILLPPTAASAA